MRNEGGDFTVEIIRVSGVTFTLSLLELFRNLAGGDHAACHESINRV
jgi:hypothetical protein